jgi:hypothetical protein
MLIEVVGNYQCLQARARVRCAFCLRRELLYRVAGGRECYRLDGARGALCGELSKMCGGCDDDVVRAPVLACENTKKARAERSEPLQVRRAYAGG